MHLSFTIICRLPLFVVYDYLSFTIICRFSLILRHSRVGVGGWGGGGVAGKAPAPANLFGNGTQNAKNIKIYVASNFSRTASDLSVYGGVELSSRIWLEFQACFQESPLQERILVGNQFCFV